MKKKLTVKSVLHVTALLLCGAILGLNIYSANAGKLVGNKLPMPFGYGAAVVLSGFTDQWRQMLAGVNIGGLGTPIASLASLITLKFYLRWPNAKIGRFMLVFTLANLAGLALLLAFALLT